MRPNTPRQLTWGQFIEGTRKQFIRLNPKAGFLMMTQKKEIWRGEFEGLRRYGGVRCGRLKVDWVYNSMPPAPQQIYPEIPLTPVTTF